MVKLLEYKIPKLGAIIFVNNQLDAQFFLCMFISILYMFRAAMCPSSGELTLILLTWSIG
jgi:hypothetical protein